MMKIPKEVQHHRDIKWGNHQKCSIQLHKLDLHQLQKQFQTHLCYHVKMQTTYLILANNDMVVGAIVYAPISQSLVDSKDDVMTMAKALDLLKTKDITVASLQIDLRKLQFKWEYKNVLISQQFVEIQCLKDKECETFTLSDMDDTFIDHNPHQLHKVTTDLTSNVLHCCPLAKCTKCSSIILSALPLAIIVDTTNDTSDLDGIKDSLSFLAVLHPVQSQKELELQDENRMLQARLSQLVATYYHWKVVCILSMTDPNKSPKTWRNFQKTSLQMPLNKILNSHRGHYWRICFPMICPCWTCPKKI